MTETQKEIHFGRPWIDDRDRKAVMEVLEGHVLTHGPKCQEFEDRFVEFMGGGHAVTTSSCMASLHLSSLHLGLGPGDEVIVPAQTHVATVHAVELVGATPVFVDCELETGNMDLLQIESKITPKTKAISLVHFAGIPVQMDVVCALAEKYNLRVIEDCALAVGGFFRDKHVGLWGNVGCFSFYPVKHITTAEGGMLVSRDEKTVREISHFRAFSVDRTYTERKIPGVYDVTGVGMNCRMSELQAALGLTQIQKMPEILRRRKQNFETLKSKLSEIKNVHVLDSNHPDVQNSYYCLVAVLSEGLKAQRNEIIEHLKKNKVGCSVYYPQPVPRMKYYKGKYGYEPSNFRNAEAISDGSIALPVGPHLDESDMKTISEIMKESIK